MVESLKSERVADHLRLWRGRHLIRVKPCVGGSTDPITGRAGRQFMSQVELRAPKAICCWPWHAIDGGRRLGALKIEHRGSQEVSMNNTGTVLTHGHRPRAARVSP
ncbi:hypothetical protein MF4836_18075 [Pseudomonas sp. MF4836]|nr:hypothetical protein MF4836_18075 [Pseudomonas sp. MF4836]